MNYNDDSGIHDPSDEDCQDSLKFHDFVTVCPNCKQQITAEMDSCPYCGDILYRYLKDSTFAPRKGPLVKVFAAIIIILVTLAALGMLLQSITW